VLLSLQKLEDGLRKLDLLRNCGQENGRRLARDDRARNSTRALRVRRQASDSGEEPAESEGQNASAKDRWLLDYLTGDSQLEEQHGAQTGGSKIETQPTATGDQERVAHLSNQKQCLCPPGKQLCQLDSFWGPKLIRGCFNLAELRVSRIGCTVLEFDGLHCPPLCLPASPPSDVSVPLPLNQLQVHLAHQVRPAQW